MHIKSVINLERGLEKFLLEQQNDKFDALISEMKKNKDLKNLYELVTTIKHSTFETVEQATNFVNESEKFSINKENLTEWVTGEYQIPEFYENIEVFYLQENNIVNLPKRILAKQFIVDYLTKKNNFNIEQLVERIETLDQEDRKFVELFQEHDNKSEFFESEKNELIALIKETISSTDHMEEKVALYEAKDKLQNTSYSISNFITLRNMKKEILS
jgi:hypothetical protein